MRYDYSQPYVTKDEYLEVKGINLDIELQADDNNSNKVNRFIQDLTNFVLDHLVMEYGCNELNRQTHDFEDLAEFRRIRFHYGMLDQIEYVLNNGLIQLNSGINMETGSITDFSGVVIGPAALRQFKLAGFCNKQEKPVCKRDLSPKDMPTVEELVLELGKKVDKVDGKGLSANDYTNSDKTLLKSVAQELNDKVDKEEGKKLTSNDFTNAYKQKLDSVQENAQANVIEEICVDNVPATISGKRVNISLNGSVDERVTRLQDESRFFENRRNKTQVINPLEPSSSAYPSEEAVIDYVESEKKNVTSYVDNQVARANLVSILGEASQQLNGLMSAQDKSNLDALIALLGPDADSDTVVNTINEVLAIFNQYPEGVEVVNVLAGKIGYDDVVNALNSTETRKPLSAAKGKELKDSLDALTITVGTTAKNLGDAYDNTATYVVGDYCIYNNTLYCCTIAVSTAEDFDSNKWTAVKVASEFVDKSSAQTITGEKIFSVGLITGGNYKIYNIGTQLRISRGGSDYYYINDSRFTPTTDNQRDLGNSSSKWKDLYLSGKIKDGTNEVGVDDIANGIVKIFDAPASGIPSGLMDAIKNGSFVWVNPNSSNSNVLMKNGALFFPVKSSVANVLGTVLYAPFGVNHETETLGKHYNGVLTDYRYLRIRNIGQFNDKNVPAYPVSPTEDKLLAYGTNDQLAYKGLSELGAAMKGTETPLTAVLDQNGAVQFAKENITDGLYMLTYANIQCFVYISDAMLQQTATSAIRVPCACLYNGQTGESAMGTLFITKVTENNVDYVKCRIVDNSGRFAASGYTVYLIKTKLL